MSQQQPSSPNPKAFYTCRKCEQLVNMTEYSCPNCGNIFWSPLSGLGCGALMTFVLIAVFLKLAFASGSSLWIIVVIAFGVLFGFIGIMMMQTFIKALLKIYRPNTLPRLEKEVVPSALSKEAVPSALDKELSKASVKGGKQCCICGKDLTGLPAMVDHATGEAFCEQDAHYFGMHPSNRLKRPIIQEPEKTEKNISGYSRAIIYCRQDFDVRSMRLPGFSGKAEVIRAGSAVDETEIIAAMLLQGCDKDNVLLSPPDYGVGFIK